MTDLLHPPRNWFNKPAELKPGMGTTITEEGHVFGYLALFNSRYINGGNGTTKPPKSRTGYKYANAFAVKTDDGDVTTGVLAGDGGHHHKGDFTRTQQAYADTKRLLARVKYGEDAHGVWFSGALWPKAEPEAVEMLRSTGVSGHWERPTPSSPLELLGACTVNIPGFAQHRLCAAATPGGGLILEPTSDTPPGDVAVQHVGSGLNPFKRGQLIPGGLAVGGKLTAAGGPLHPVEGILCVLDSPTIDGRLIKAVNFPPLPLPLHYSDSMPDWGHSGAVNVGSITEIVEDGSIVRFKGLVDSALSATQEANIIADLKVLGVSMDGYPDDDVEIIWGEDGWPESIVFNMYNIIGATLLTTPAFQETRPIVFGAPVDAVEDETEEVETEEAETAVDVEEAAAAVLIEEFAGDTSADSADGQSAITTIRPPIAWH